MTTSVEAALVEEYLGRLRAALAGHPADQQREVLAEVESHIASARAELPGGEASVRTVLERLGDPEEIAASAGGAPTPPQAPPVPSGRREIVGLVFLAVGGLVIPVLGWVVGLVLLWTSRVWTRGDKLLGTLLIPGGLGSLPWLWLPATTKNTANEICAARLDATVATQACSDGSAAGADVVALTLLAAAVAGSVVTLIVLARRVAAR